MVTVLGANTLLGGDLVTNSLRFNRGSTDFLNRTLGTPTNVDKATFSTWIKFSDVTSSNDTVIFAATVDGNTTTHLEKLGSQVFRFNMREGSNYIGVLTTNREFRDPSAWYHIVLAFDTTQGTGSNRIKLYINGVQETSFSTATYPTQNVDLRFNTSGQVFRIGHRGDTANGPDAYFSETVLVDGLQLAPTSFGEFDSDSGIWVPIDVSGLTFGDNGSYLQYKASGTGANASGMGADTSGNTNHFTVNNLTAVDQATDTCQNNFATMNPLDNFYAGGTFTEGNLQVATRDTGYSYNTATVGLSSGKWYWEVKWSAQTGSTNQVVIGIAKRIVESTTVWLGSVAWTYGYQGSSGHVHVSDGNATNSTSTTYSVGDTISVAMDLDNNKIHFAKNGTYTNSSNPAGNSGGVAIAAADSTSEDSGFYFPAFGDGNNNLIETGQFNFGGGCPQAISSAVSDANGHGNFEFAVPAGYLAICTKNIAEVLG